MTTIVTRAGKGSPLTHTEVDTNFTNLNTAKLEAGAIALGSAAAPSISFTGDNNTGVFSPGADQVAISSNGTGKLFVDSTGNIGTGAASPSAWSYGGNITIPGAGRYIASTSDDIRFASNLYESDVARYSANGFAARYRIADGTHQWSIAATGTAGNAITLNEAMRILATGDVAIDTNTLYVDAVNNRVGLGSSSPAAQFQVNATSDTSIALSNSSSVTSGNRGNISMLNSAVSTVGLIRFAAVTDNVGTEIQFHTRPAAGSLTQSMTLDSSGRLAIGTTTPSRLLHLSAADSTSFSSADFDQTYNFLRIVNTTNDKAAGIYFGIGTNGEAAITAAETTDGETALVFGTRGGGARSERARLDHAGRLLVGTSSSSSDSVIVVQGYAGVSAGAGEISITRGGTPSTADQGLGTIKFQNNNNNTGAQIDAFSEGSWTGGSNHRSRLVFSTTPSGSATPTERMRINNGGVLLVGKQAESFSTPGFSAGTGGIVCARNDLPVLYVSRITDDGTLVSFYQGGTEEGTISVSGTTVSYNGAHLSRWSQLPGGATREEILRGTVLSNIDEMCGWGEEENEQLNRMKVSDVEGDKNVSGVFQAWDDDDDTYTDDFYCAMTGDFIIRIAEGVTVERGDLLMSAGDGTAKPQADDIIRSKTIAKVTSTYVTCTYEDGSYCVPCVLMAC